MSRRNSLITVLGRSLVTQLDRLRHTLNSLGQRLREAVARAVGETVGTAVRQTLHAALDDSAREEEIDRPFEPRYHDPPLRHEREERSWNDPSWNDYPGWRDTEDADYVAYPEETPAREPKGRGGAAVQMLLVGCQAAAWWLRRHSPRCPLLAALGIGAACGVAAYLGGPVIIAGVGLAGSALGLVTLAEAARSGVQMLAGTDTPD